MHVFVILSAIFLLVSAQPSCPYERPQDEAMTCLQDMPRMDTGARPNADEENGVLGVPEIPEEPADHFCSPNGTAMVNCMSRVYKLCKGDAGLTQVHYNPEAAEKALSLCKDHYKEFKDALSCIKSSQADQGMRDCIVNVQHEAMEREIPPEMLSCSTTAGMYNCLVTIVGGDCGKPMVGFMISIWRTMEHPYCTKMINEEYKEPVSEGIQLQASLMSLFVLLMILVTF